MTRRLLFTVAALSALLIPATAGAYLNSSNSGVATSAARNSIATGNQTEGRLEPNSCATRSLIVTRPSSIQVLLAGSNAGGHLYTQVISPNGTAGPEGGSYEATTPGAYGVRVCFSSDDGIDSQISYVYATLVTPR
jgi:hypothetical protein